ncbi:MAG: SURF1 family protein [Nocardioidaceae bacterium]|nr:SURF1 family protein [Nocardioidaceae bacterium]
MRQFRFLLSRRWILLALAVVLLSYLAYVLGQWQFHRLADRKERNAITVRNESGTPAPLGGVLAIGRPVPATSEWKLVTATGRYDQDGTVVVRYSTRNGASGVDVVVPLVTDSGTVLVDRGWLRADNTSATPDDVPPPPPGDVTIQGWVRADATGDSTVVTDGSTRAISSRTIGDYLGRDLLSGFVELKSEDPAPDQPLVPVELPDLGNGPHFFYGLQWWFFGLLAVGGFIYLAWDEWRNPGARPATSGSDARASAAARRPPEA